VLEWNSEILVSDFGNNTARLGDFLK
jgi:hypothetical protein